MKTDLVTFFICGTFCRCSFRGGAKTDGRLVWLDSPKHSETKPVESVQPRDEEKESRDLALLNGVTSDVTRERSGIEGASMAASTGLAPGFDAESFVHEYYDAWGGTDRDRILRHAPDAAPDHHPQGKRRHVR